MKTTLIAAVAGIAAVTASASAGGPNLLNNAGFEEALGFDFADTSNWNGFFGGPAGTFLEAFNDTGETPFAGNQALRLSIEGVPGLTQGFGAFTGHVQTVGGIVAGEIYELSVWAKGIGDITNGAEMRIEYKDAMGNQIGGQFDFNMEIQDMLTSEYQQMSVTSTAPDGAASANIVFAVQSFLNDGVEADISVALDNASLTIVPAPASLAMLGLGGLAASRRRR